MGKTNGFMKKTLFALMAVLAVVNRLFLFCRRTQKRQRSDIRPEKIHIDGRGAFYAEY